MTTLCSKTGIEKSTLWLKYLLMQMELTDYEPECPIVGLET